MSAQEKIQSMIDENKIMLFMKGDRKFPQCGFSGMACQILDHVGVEYMTNNVLDDNEIREGIKQYSDWPTIPQIYINKEFIGGCDILREMAENGEIIDLLKKNKISYEISKDK